MRNNKWPPFNPYEKQPILDLETALLILGGLAMIGLMMLFPEWFGGVSR